MGTLLGRGCLYPADLQREFRLGDPRGAGLRRSRHHHPRNPLEGTGGEVLWMVDTLGSGSPGGSDTKGDILDRRGKVADGSSGPPTGGGKIYMGVGGQKYEASL